MTKAVLVISIVIVLLIAGGLIYYFSASSSQSPDTNTDDAVKPVNYSGPIQHSIEISGFAFSPTTLNIKVGDRVTWTNMDSAPHTVTSDSGSELVSSTLDQRQSYSHTFSQPGTFTYHCRFHS